jgi:hypothetical protein
MMAILAYDVKGVFMCCPIPLGQSMDALYYKSFMQCQLHSAARKKCLEQVVNAIIQSENAIISLLSTVKNVLWFWLLEVM